MMMTYRVWQFWTWEAWMNLFFWSLIRKYKWWWPRPTEHIIYGWTVMIVLFLIINR
jgi:hypothetical protein